MRSRNRHQKSFPVAKLTVKERHFLGKCYNFALGFAHDWQLEKGYCDMDEVKSLAQLLSSKVQKTVDQFFKGTKVIAR